jgi:hypothetical protein
MKEINFKNQSSKIREVSIFKTLTLEHLKFVIWSLSEVWILIFGLFKRGIFA